VNETPRPPLSGQTPASAGGETYPLTFDVPYPTRNLDRISTGLRIFAVIPIAIVLATLTSSYGWGGYTLAAGAGGTMFLVVLLMILFRQKYPRWWFDWNRELLRVLKPRGRVPAAAERPVPLHR
jgi:hypothetical protein